MGLFKKKKQENVTEAAEQVVAKDYYPIEHVASSLKAYQQELVDKEVASLQELHDVRDAFAEVLESNNMLREKLGSFAGMFDTVGQNSGKFEQVKDEIGASIEAARAGEQGKGFAVVAEEVKSLADEIKSLVGNVEGRISDVQQGTEKLNKSIEVSQASLQGSMENVDATNETFHKITSAASGADVVQEEIASAAATASGELKQVEQAFDRIEMQYDTVMNHINCVNDLGTTKSTIFEYMDNMLSQIKPILDDM